MKHGKKPSLKQKKLIKDSGLNPDQWLVVKNLPGQLKIAHRETGQQKTINLGGF